MEPLPDGKVAVPSQKCGSSFSSSLMDGSPPMSCFQSTDFEGHHLQAPHGPWKPSPAAQMDTLQFTFAEDHGDTRRLLRAFLTGTDGYGNTQFGSPPTGSSSWDNKLSYMSSAASSGLAVNPLGIPANGQMQGGLPQVTVRNSARIPGHGQMHAGLMHVNMEQGHTNSGLDYAHPALDHMHTGQANIDGDVSSRKIMMLTPSWVPLNSVDGAMDPSSECLPAQAMNLTVPHGLPNLPCDPGFTDRAARFSSFSNMGYSESHLGGDCGKDLNKAKLNLMSSVRQSSFTNHLASGSPSVFINENSTKAQENARFPLKEASPAVPTSSALLMDESIKGLESRTSLPPTINMVVNGEAEGTQKQFCASFNESDESMGQEVSSSSGAAPLQGISDKAGRKRKAVLQKVRDGGVLTTNLKDLDPDDGRPKCQGGGDNSILDKSLKPQEQSNSGNSEDSTPKSGKEVSKPLEAPKPDYIHVRARRGQATDSHSLAERVRREKISERMKFLQDLVPGCSKVTGKAVMLDEIINYVQSLQRQVEFLSMKLASVNPRVEFSIDNLFPRERPVQPCVVTPASVFGLQNGNMFSFQPLQQPHVPMQPLDLCPPPETPFGPDGVLRRTMSTPPSMEAYGGDATPQASQAWDNELQNVVQMGFAQQQAALDIPGSVFQGQMKVEH